jgi:hypothetical protein
MACDTLGEFPYLTLTIGLRAARRATCGNSAGSAAALRAQGPGHRFNCDACALMTIGGSAPSSSRTVISAPGFLDLRYSELAK